MEWAAGRFRAVPSPMVGAIAVARVGPWRDEAMPMSGAVARGLDGAIPMVGALPRSGSGALAMSGAIAEPKLGAATLSKQKRKAG